MLPKVVIPTRLNIYASDVMQVSGCSYSTANRKLNQVKDAKGKKDLHQITIKEYCEYWSLDYEVYCRFLKLID